MEFLKLVRRRSFLSEAVYTVLNIVLAVALLIVIVYTGSIALALLLVLISKWRVFAVRPRYWVANFRANLVDFIVSISVVFHLFSVSTVPLADGQRVLFLLIITMAYIAWLLFLKPRSRRKYVVAQAGVAVLLGVSALFVVSYNWDSFGVVVGMWLIGFAAARHVLSSYDNETHALFLGLAWGFVLAELGWIAYHVTIGHPLPTAPALMIPQVAITATLISFVAYKVYDSFAHHQSVRATDVAMPVVFTVALLLSLWFALPTIQCAAPTALICLNYL